MLVMLITSALSGPKSWVLAQAACPASLKSCSAYGFVGLRKHGSWTLTFRCQALKVRPNEAMKNPGRSENAQYSFRAAFGMSAVYYDFVLFCQSFACELVTKVFSNVTRFLVFFYSIAFLSEYVNNWLEAAQVMFVGGLLLWSPFTMGYVKDHE
jgi:fatty acid desaturase